MGILQATSTQNDYVLSMWLVCMVYFMLIMVDKNNQKGLSLIYTFAIGCSLGLAILTKGTAYVFVLPFILWFFIKSFNKYRASSLKIFLIFPKLSIQNLPINNLFRV